jgi:protein required for attachment to host cells
MQKTWPKTCVVVADRVRGRIFSAPKPKSPLEEIDDLVHPESRAHERDLTTDRPGRGPGSHRAMGNANTARDHEAADFARELAARLESGRTHGEFEKLILIASPDFLGLLRKHLSPPLARMVTLEMPKVLTQLSAAEIREHLPEYL